MAESWRDRKGLVAALLVLAAGVWAAVGWRVVVGVGGPEADEALVPISVPEAALRPGGGWTPREYVGLFPPLLPRMVGVGEATGELAEVLAQTAGHFEREVDASVDALTSVIEPVLVVVLGVVVGGVLVAIYLPMFDLVTVLE